ncbi:MAG: hypothetical protein KJ721_02475 [Nanoarchaeota archaeon]|nr:hypothetical protein [Nanoarchaeota archaeon]
MKRGLVILILVILMCVQFAVSDGVSVMRTCTETVGWTILKCTKVTEQGCVYNFDDECAEWDRGVRTGNCGRWYESKESYSCFDDWQSSCMLNPVCPSGYSQVSSKGCSEDICIEESVSLPKEPVQTPICIDSDVTEDFPNGKNYFLKGIVSVGNMSKEDICYNSSLLREFYCENQSSSEKEHICLDGCVDGACLPSLKKEGTSEKIYKDAGKNMIEIHPVEEPPSEMIKNDSGVNETPSIEKPPLKVVSKEELKTFKVQATNNSVSDVIKSVEPKTITEVKVKTENNTKIYEVKSVQDVETDKGLISVEAVNKVDSKSGEVEQTERVVKKGDFVFKEEYNEVILVQDGELVKIKGVDNKEVKIEKMMSKSVKPLVNLGKIVIPAVIKDEKVLLKINKDSDFSDYEVIFEAKDYVIIIVTTDDLESLINNKDVLKISDEDNQEAFIEYEEEILQDEVKDFSEEQELQKSSDGVTDIDKLEDYLKADDWVIQEGQESYYQQFVTPNEVKDYVGDLDKEELYEKAVSFVWMSDSVLHGRPEKWMKPAEFLSESAGLPLNPIGEIASDCSEQANTLASMLRASGVSAKDVRVVLGQVNFSDIVGGHAWVEIKEDDKWMVLDPSLGPFYDETFNIKIKREGVKYNYWKYHKYPSVKIWAYYNDVYFTDEEAEVAEGWSKKAETALRSSIFEGFDRGMFANFFAWLKGLFG